MKRGGLEEIVNYELKTKRQMKIWASFFAAAGLV